MRGIHAALGVIYRNTGHPDWAAQAEERELQLGIPDCATERLVCDFLGGRFKEVLAAVGKDLKPEAHYWRAQAYSQLALEALSKLETLPPSAELHEVMGEIYRNQGRHRDSAAAWRKALELSPGHPIARKELAVSLMLALDYESAQPLVDGLLAEEPRSAQYNYMAGDIRLNQQKPNEAVPFLTKAVQYDPTLVVARASLGRALVSLGDTAQAIPHLKLALVLDQDGSIHYQLARAYRSTGQNDLAAQMLERYQAIQKSMQREKEQLEKEARITPP
jgi:predicted Zn-dependent protease